MKTIMLAKTGKIIAGLLAIIAISLTGCVQNGTIGNGQLDPAEQEAIEAIVEQVQQIIADKQKDKVTSDVSDTEPAPVVDEVTDDPPVVPPASATTTEVLQYHGRYNGDRPTWYGSKNFNQYPSPVYLTVNGCLKRSEIQHDGKRVEFDGYTGYILKQSDVSYKGLGVVGPASCKSKTATLEY